MASLCSQGEQKGLSLLLVLLVAGQVKWGEAEVGGDRQTDLMPAVGKGAPSPRKGKFLRWVCKMSGSSLDAEGECI